MSSLERNIKPYSKAIVKLLKGSIERTSNVWDDVVNYQTEIQDYISQIGLELIVKKEEGFAFVKQFEETMANTDIGKISRPFKSQFGWHILQVLERRQEDMSDQMKRNQAANTLRSRRFDEEFQLWLTQIREEAYVEIKL